MASPASAYGVRVHHADCSADIPRPACASWAKAGISPFMTANTPVMVSTVVSSVAQVARCLRCRVATSGWPLRFSVRQNSANAAADTTTRTAMSGQFAAASLPASFSAISSAPTETTSSATPGQSIREATGAFDSGVRVAISTVARAAMTAIAQKTDWKPWLSAR